MPIRFFLFLSTFLLFSFTSLGQEFTISGTVTDAESGETLVGVAILINNSGGIATDVDGKYKIMTGPGKLVLEFSFVGYETQTKVLHLGGEVFQVLDIALSPDAELLDVVVVSAGKFEQKVEEVTVSMEVIQPKLIENKNVNDIEVIMDQVPGVTVIDGQANIRGGGGFSYGAGSRVLVLVDGMPMLAADANDVKWNFLPIENLAQLEVVKGASSALYGSSALNGVINLRTQTPNEKPLTKINVFNGVYNDPVRRDSTGNPKDTFGNISKPLKWWSNRTPTYQGLDFLHARQIKQVGLTVGGNAYSDEGYRQGEREQRFRLNAKTEVKSKKITGLSWGASATAQRNTGALFLLWQDGDSGAYKPLGGIDTATTTLTSYTSWRAHFDPYIQFFSSSTTKHIFRTRYFYSANLATNAQTAHAHMVYGEYQLQKRFKNELLITTGLATKNDIVLSDLYGDHSGRNLALYGQADKKVGRLNLSMGLRMEYFRIDDDESESEVGLMNGILGENGVTLIKKSPIKPVVRFGANYRLLEATWLRGSYGEGYRFPSIGEKYVNTNVGLLQVFPNADLEAETGWSTELGVKQGLKFGKWKGFLDVAGFYTRYNNMMEFTFGVFNPDSLPPTIEWVGFKSINQEQAEISGVESSLMLQGEFLGIKTTIFGGYTYMNPITSNRDSAYLATVSDTSSNVLKYRFRHLTKGDVQFDWRKWSMGFSMRHNSFMEAVDKVFEEDFILNGAKEYRRVNNTGVVVFDFRMSFKVHETSQISLVSNNLFNKEYMGRPGDVKAPRTIALRYSLRF